MKKQKNRLTSKEIESVIQFLSQNNAQETDVFIVESYQTLPEERTPILLKLFQNAKEEETLPNRFYEAVITLMPKPEKHTLGKGDNKPVSPTNADVF